MPQSHPTPPLTLSDTRLDPADADDLRWLWNCSASEMGERSPMGPMIDRLREGRVGPTHIDEDTADAKALRQAAVATRVRRIEARLARVDARHRTTLKATLGPGLPPGTTEVYARMGTATLPVTLLLLTADREGVARVQFRRYVTPPQGKDAQAVGQWRAWADEQIHALRRAASSALLAATLAYSGTRATRTEAP